MSENGPYPSLSILNPRGEGWGKEEVDLHAVVGS